MSRESSRLRRPMGAVMVVCVAFGAGLVLHVGVLVSSAANASLAPPKVRVAHTGQNYVFSFRSTAPRARFLCSIDRPRLQRCAGTYRVRLSLGPHVLRVQAVSGSSMSTVRRVTVQVAGPSIPVGATPVSAATSPGAVWVTNYGDGTVSKIGTSVRRVISTLRIGGSPFGISLGGGFLWVGNADGTISKIDPGSAKVVARWTIGGQPLTPVWADGVLWVANNDGSVERVNSTSGRVEKRIELGGASVVAVSGFGRIWVANEDGSVSAIDPATNTAERIEVAPHIADLAVGPDSIWVAAFDGRSVSRISGATRTVTNRLSMRSQIAGVVFFDGAVWASNYNSGSVARINPATNRVVATVPVGALPRSIVAAADKLWVVNQASRSVSIVTP